MPETYTPGPLSATAVHEIDAAMLGGLICRNCGHIIDGGDFRVSKHEDYNDVTHVEIEVICSACHRTGAKLNISVEPPLDLFDEVANAV